MNLKCVYVSFIFLSIPNINLYYKIYIATHKGKHNNHSKHFSNLFTTPTGKLSGLKSSNMCPSLIILHVHVSTCMCVYDHYDNIDLN